MNYYEYYDYLAHFGIKGMKWGVRRYQNKDGSLTPAGKRRYSEDYSEKQRIRDRKIYGKGAEKRINKRMLNGESIQSARHDEVVRKEKKEQNKRRVKKVVKTTTKIATAVAVPVATAAIMRKYGIMTPEDLLDAYPQMLNDGKRTVSKILNSGKNLANNVVNKTKR